MKEPYFPSTIQVDYSAVGMPLPFEEEKYIQALTEDVINYYCGIGIVPSTERLLVIKHPQQSYPQFCPLEDNPCLPCDIIFLSIKDYSFWSQVVYQLAHEYTHYLIHHQNPNGKQKAMWVEESICEAMSLVLLYQFATHWNTCRLSRVNTGYGVSIATYLNNLMETSGNQRLTNCCGLAELLEIEQTCQVTRNDRLAEVQKLYRLTRDETDVCGLICYRNYIFPQKHILDIDRYLSDFPASKSVQYICALQSNAIERDGKIL